jgi:hypothetical protein
MGHGSHGAENGHGEHGGGMHEGHEEMFRRRFFLSTLLSIPVLLYSEALQAWLGFSVPAFPGNEWINPVFAVIVFAYGGIPFLRMAVPEVRERSPGMMTLISIAISAAFVYSLASVVGLAETAFFWELVTLIDVMLLGHWIEMRSVRRASSALDELAKLLPDTAERVTETGETADVPVSDLSEDDLVLVRPGASVPADGVVAPRLERRVVVQVTRDLGLPGPEGRPGRSLADVLVRAHRELDPVQVPLDPGLGAGLDDPRALVDPGDPGEGVRVGGDEPLTPSVRSPRGSSGR